MTERDPTEPERRAEPPPSSERIAPVSFRHSSAYPLGPGGERQGCGARRWQN